MPNKLFAWACSVAMVSARVAAIAADILAAVCFFMLVLTFCVVVLQETCSGTRKLRCSCSCFDEVTRSELIFRAEDARCPRAGVFKADTRDFYRVLLSLPMRYYPQSLEISIRSVPSLVRDRKQPQNSIPCFSITKPGERGPANRAVDVIICGIDNNVC